MRQLLQKFAALANYGNISKGMYDVLADEMTYWMEKEWIQEEKQLVENEESEKPTQAHRVMYWELVKPDVNNDSNRMKDLGDAVSDSSLSHFNIKDLPIASNYPKAYELLLQRKSFLTLMVDPSKSKENVRVDASVLGLFYKGGFDAVFEDYPISAARSVDGKAHMVNSYEEFMK